MNWVEQSLLCRVLCIRSRYWVVFYELGRDIGSCFMNWVEKSLLVVFYELGRDIGSCIVKSILGSSWVVRDEIAVGRETWS
ncbi:hypothetical protein F511_00328 [Dorcoceras hygrometricum]|nr:hypothetical protein F511_00328 [Dorcoceras hygrometricum]